MPKRTLSTAAVASSTKKSKKRPIRAAAQRALSAVQTEARHVETFEPAQEKRVAPVKKQSTPASATARPQKKKTGSLQARLTTVNKRISKTAARRSVPPAREDDDIVDADYIEEVRPDQAADEGEDLSKGKSVAGPPSPPGGGGGAAAPSKGTDVRDDGEEAERGHENGAARRGADGGGDSAPQSGPPDLQNPRHKLNSVRLSQPRPSAPTHAGAASGVHDDCIEVSGVEEVPPMQDVALAAVARKVNANAESLDELLFRVAALQGSIDDIRSKVVGVSAEEKPETKKEKGIDGWKALMDERFPDIATYFPVELWRNAIMYATIEHMESMPRTDGVLGIVDGMRGVCSILLSRTAKKEIFDTPVGKCASTYRFLVLSRALALARAGHFAGEADVKTEKPEWLGMHGNQLYILKEHIVAGQEYHEKKQSNTAPYLRRVAIGNGKDPARDDFASFIMIKLYKIMNDVFMECRRRVRDDLAVYFTFLFKEWGKFNVIVSDDSVDLRWGVPFEHMQRLTDDRIRECLERDTDSHTADAWNRSVYEHMARQKSLRLLIGHDILMAKGKQGTGAQRAHAADPDGKVRYFRRWMSMLVPSAVFYLGWSNMPVDMPAYKALRIHPKSMQVLYGTALLFRDVFDLHPARAIADGLNSKHTSGREVEGTADEQSLLRMFFDILIPGKTCFERAMERTTMAISDKQYDEQHVLTTKERELRDAVLGKRVVPPASEDPAPGATSPKAGEGAASPNAKPVTSSAPSRSDARPATGESAPSPPAAAEREEMDWGAEKDDARPPSRRSAPVQGAPAAVVEEGARSASPDARAGRSASAVPILHEAAARAKERVAGIELEDGSDDGVDVDGSAESLDVVVPSSLIVHANVENGGQRSRPSPRESTKAGEEGDSGGDDRGE